MPIRTFLILGLALLSLSARAGEAAVCNYYLGLQAKLGCDASAYPLRFGHPLCHEFALANEDFSPPGRLVMARIRRCLTASLASREESLTCGNVESVALSTHVGCYVRSGFCHLPLGDKFLTYAHLRSVALQPQMWSQAFLLNEACAVAR